MIDADLAIHAAPTHSWTLGDFCELLRFPKTRTRGCPPWSFKVRDGDRDLDVVSTCSLKVMLGT
jgi:hypothetical protein